MRSLDLFVGLVGTLPAITFAGTLWLNDGAPFEPFETRTTASVYGAGRAPMVVDGPSLPVAPAAGVLVAVPPDEMGDAGLDRLYRLARAGDREAVLLLAIIDGGRGRVADARYMGAGSRTGP
jgi:hypothetical protein